jgi:ketosteroid isomerase-like protein
MKKFILLSILSFSFLFNSNAQWMKKTSCKKNAAKIVDGALNHLMNLEQLPAIGMAEAALLLDENCGCAKLIKARASSSNKNWGSRADKLSKIDTSSLSSEELAWYNILTASQENSENAYKKASLDFPNSPFIQYISIKAQDWDKYEGYIEKFPDYASSALNMMAYGYVNGAYGEKDHEKANELTDKSLALHFGPNALDSKAEHAAMNGDYKKALDYQLKAVDFASFSSPYNVNATKYWRLSNTEQIKNSLKENMKKLQDAILTQNLDEYNKYIDEDVTVMTGDSNLSKFYSFDSERFNIDQKAKWGAFDLYDINVTLSPDVKTAVLTFYAKGNYTVDDSAQVDYSTRASSVWIFTDNGWKFMHSNWAPLEGGTGIPK